MAKEITYGKKITITGSRWQTTNGQKTQEVHYQYEEKIVHLLDLMKNHKAGVALLNDIDWYKGSGKITITPPLASAKRGCGAGLKLYKKGDKMVRDNTVEFVPSSFGAACAGVGTSPEEALYHELVHAAQVIRGILSTKPIPKAPHMSNFTEFCAVTASNVLRSEMGRLDLRAGHDGTDMATTLTDPRDYHDFYEIEMDTWFRIQAGFCEQMARVAARFNPFHAKLEADRTRGTIPIMKPGVSPPSPIS